jgi:ribosomal protein S15P/S13E
MNFERQIQQWVSVDNQLKTLNEKIKELRDSKQQLSSSILSHVEKNNLSNSTIQTGDGKLKFIQSKTVQPVTFKYLETCLKEIIKNENQIKQIIDYIKQKREMKYAFEIKRL